MMILKFLLMATKTSPTQRSLAHLRELGYHVEIVEKWNSFTKQRKDLWGWADLLAIRKGEVLAVQVTASAVSDRIKDYGFRHSGTCERCGNQNRSTRSGENPLRPTNMF